MSMNEEIASSPIVSPTARLALGHYGRFIPTQPQPADDLPAGDVAVLFELTVYTPRFDDPSTSDPFVSHRYSTVDFPLSLLPELGQLISAAISCEHQSVIGGDDNEVFEFLAEHVTSFLLNDLMVANLSSPENACVVRASLFLVEEAATDGGPPEAAEAVPATAVAYRNKQMEKSGSGEDEAAEVTETSCPICLADFEDGEEVQVTPCGHPFHVGCLERWLQLKVECPLCRSGRVVATCI